MITVVTGTYGDVDYWGELVERAERSVGESAEFIWVHGPNRHEARNEGARRASGTRLVFLDADDELSDGFCDLVVECEDVLQPKTIYRDGDQETAPDWIPPREDFLMGNHIVVGAPVNRDVFLESGGFEPFPIAEDWALWLKLKRAGASFGRTHATYIVNVNHNGVNSQPDNGVYDLIRSIYR